MTGLITILFLIIPPFNGEYCSTYNKDFKGYRFKEQIPVCKRNVSTARKNKICKRDGVNDRRDFIVDHIIPLSMGGDNSNQNLWCQHKSINTANAEGYAFRKLDEGKWTAAKARDYVRGIKFNSN